MNYKGKNVLVTGGTGFVGSHLIKELLNQGANVVSTTLTHNPSSYFSSELLEDKVTLAQVDITDYSKIFDLITKKEIEYIFHLAAQPLVDVAYYNPLQTLTTNITGTINILESARNYPEIKGIIVASSDKAYGKLTKEKYFEDNPLIGDHPYEVSKSCADLITTSYYKTYNLPVAVTRFGNIYGEGDLNFSRIIPGIMNSIITNTTLEIRSNGKYVRDYLYVKDVVNSYLLLMNKIDEIKGEVYNLGSDDTLSVIDLIKTVEKELDKKIDYKILDKAKNEIPYQSLNFDKIKKSVGWKSKHNVKSSIQGIYNWYLNNYKKNHHETN